MRSVDVSVRRVGGAYGAKISRAHWIAAGCALAAHATGRSASFSDSQVTDDVVSSPDLSVCTWTLILT